MKVDRTEEDAFMEALYKAVQNTKNLASEVGNGTSSFKAIQNAMYKIAQREEIAAKATESLLQAAYQRGFAHGQANPPRD